MSTKILIDAKTFEDILKRHPEVEVDLLRSVTPQLAARIGDRIKDEVRKIERAEAAVANGDYDERLKKALSHQLDRLGQAYGMTDGAKAAVRGYLKAECEQEAKTLLWGNIDREIARKVEAAFKERESQVRDICAKVVEETKAVIDAHAQGAAEKHVLALLRAGKLTVAA